MASAAAILTPANRTDTATIALNKAAKHWRSNAFLQTICFLADYLDQHPTPINYQRRRELDLSELLAEPVWDQIAWTHHASRRLRHHTVRAWLYQHDIDEPTTWHPPTSLAPAGMPPPAAVDPARLHALTDRLSTPLARIASKLGTSLAHIRLLLEDHPLPSRA